MQLAQVAAGGGGSASAPKPTELHQIQRLPTLVTAGHNPRRTQPVVHGDPRHIARYTFRMPAMPKRPGLQRKEDGATGGIGRVNPSVTAGDLEPSVCRSLIAGLLVGHGGVVGRQPGIHSNQDPCGLFQAPRRLVRAVLVHQHQAEGCLGLADRQAV